MRYFVDVTDQTSPDAATPGAPALPPRRFDPGTAVTSISAPRGWPGLALGEAWDYRSICLVLAQRALKVRYRQTLVGVAWVLIQPLALMAVFTVFFGLLARLPTEGVPYPLFYLSALSLWQVMVKVLNEGTASVVANASLVNRVYFPRVYFPVSVAIASLVDLIVNTIALAMVMLVFGVAPTPAIVIAPLLVAVGYATVLGCAFYLSALNVAYRDVGVMLPLIAQVWFFVTPILYSPSIVPANFQWLYYLNPLALVIGGYRWLLFGTTPPPTVAWPLAISVAAFVCVTGYAFFRRRQATFADVV